MGRGNGRGGDATGYGLICVCFTVGLGLFIGGMVWVSKSTGQRAQQISTFNAAVAAWTPALQAAFAARVWNVTSTDVGATSFLLAPTTSYEQCSIEQGGSDGIAALTSVPRTAFASLSFPFSPMSGGAILGTSGNEVRSLVVTDTLSGARSTVPITLSRSYSFLDDNSNCQYGQYTIGNCNIYLAASGPVCLVADQLGGSWRIIGPCAVSSQEAGFAQYPPGSGDDNTAPSRLGYTTLVTVGGASFTSPQMAWAGNAIVVRSNADPYAVFVSATSGYPVFGGRQLLFYTKGWILGGIGLSFIIILFGCFAIVCCCAFADAGHCRGCLGARRAPQQNVAATSATPLQELPSDNSGAHDNVVLATAGARSRRTASGTRTVFGAALANRMGAVAAATGYPITATVRRISGDKNTDKNRIENLERAADPALSATLSGVAPPLPPPPPPPPEP